LPTIAMTPTSTPATASRITERRLDQPWLACYSGYGVEHATVRAQREEQPRGVSQEQHERHASGQPLGLAAEVHALFADPGQLAAVNELEPGGQHERREREQEHRRLRVGRGAAEGLLVVAQPTEEHRRAEYEQDVPDDLSDQGRLDDLLSPASRAKNAIISSGAFRR
jgi:hypothetical protein